MTFFSFIVLLLSSTALWASDHIALSQNHINRLGIKLAKPEPSTRIPLLNAPATITIPPTHSYIVSATQSGLIDKLYVGLGDPVKKGAPLASLKSADFLTLQLNFLQALNDLQLARAEFIRNKELHEEGIIAAKRWQQAKTKFSILTSHYKEARQMLKIAGLPETTIKQLARSGKFNDSLTITSPIEGIILKSFILPGKRVDKLTPLFEVADLSQLWLAINVPQHNISRIRKGDIVRIPGTKVSATVFFIARNVNPNNQTVLVRARVDQGLDKVRPGQKINTQIYRMIHGHAFKIPNTALIQVNNSSYVFIQDASGFLAQPVTILGAQGRFSLVKNIPENSLIVVKGTSLLKSQLADQSGEE